MAQISYKFEYAVEAEYPVEEGDKMVVGWGFTSKEEALDKLGKLVDEHPMCHFNVCKSVKRPGEEA